MGGTQGNCRILWVDKKEYVFYYPCIAIRALVRYCLKGGVCIAEKQLVNLN